MESVSGGEVRIPSSRAEIDAIWDAVQATADAGDYDAAAAMAYNMGLIPFAATSDNENYFYAEKPISVMRNWMHEALEWIQA